MLFKDVYGQDAVKQLLISSVKEGRISHAQLFCGPKGTGKLALALAYAQYICCENRGENDSCGVCPSCVKYQKLIHPDLHFVFPIVKSDSKAAYCSDFMDQWRELVTESPYFDFDKWMSTFKSDKGQGMIYVTESEVIIHKLSQKAYESEYKVMIIWLPERMNEVCANKILKILEEPSGKTLFLLVTEDSEKLLSTIISRTQRVLVPRIDEESMRRAVAERFCVQEPQLSDVVRIANGDLTMAESIISSTDEDKEFFELFCMVMRAAYARKLFEIKAWAETMAKGMNRKRQVSFLAYAQRMIRENFIMNVQREDLNYMTSYENSFSVRFSPFVNEHNIWGLLSELELAERHIEQNVQAKLVFFDLALKLIMLLKK